MSRWFLFGHLLSMQSDDQAIVRNRLRADAADDADSFHRILGRTGLAKAFAGRYAIDGVGDNAVDAP